MSITVITVQQVRTQPFRKRINIPISDSTSMAWWERQVDPSTSVRLLILEEARNHGLVDRMNRIGFPTATAQPATVPPATVPNAPTAAPQPTTAVPTQVQPAGPTAAAATTAASGLPTLVTDPRDIELDLMREELRHLRSMVGTPPLFNVA